MYQTKKTYLCFLIIMCIANSLIAQSNANQKLIGIWKCESYNITVKAYENGNSICANLLTFPCNHKIKKTLSEHFDSHNPNKNLRSRSLLNIMVLSKLNYEGNNKWINGEVYEPVMGLFYSAYIKMINESKIIIHGYAGFEFIGKSLIFNKIIN